MSDLGVSGVNSRCHLLVSDLIRIQISVWFRKGCSKVLLSYFRYPNISPTVYFLLFFFLLRHYLFNETSVCRVAALKRVMMLMALSSSRARRNASPLKTQYANRLMQVSLLLVYTSNPFLANSCQNFIASFWVCLTVFPFKR